MAGRLQPLTIRDEAALHSINTNHYPLYWIGNEGQQLGPVPDLVTAQLQRFLQPGIEQKQALFDGPVPKGKQPSLGLTSREVGDVLHHGDEARAIEALMRAFIGMEKQV